MINYSRLGTKIKKKITDFSKFISVGLGKPEEKFVNDMVFGFIRSNSVKLSEIARGLKEEILLKKTIERLSRNLSNFSSQSTLEHNYIQTVKK